MIRKIFFSFLVLTLFISCEKDNSEAYEEILKVEVRSVNKTDNQHFFILIENDQSTPVFKEFQNYSEYTFLRNNKIKGDKINIHTISVNTFGNSPTYNITSFTSVPVGRSAVFGEDNILNEKSTTSRVNLKFENVPDFDIVTRSVHTQRHCNTQKSFDEVPGEPTGESTFPVNETFYACFQTGDMAEYLVRKIESYESPYTISFDSLNSKMTYYALPKKMGNSDISQISVTGYDGETFAVQLFNLIDISVFPGDNIDFFLPNSGLNLSQFLINYSTYIGNTFYSNVFSSETIINTPELINADLTVPSELGINLDFTSTGDADIISAKVTYLGSWWNIYGNSGDEMYFPAFPQELTDMTGTPEFMSSAESVIISLFDYSEVNGYSEALSKLMDDSNSFMDSTGSSYTSLQKVIPYKH